MILWAYFPGAKKATFTLSGQDPYIGLVFSPFDGRLHDPKELLAPSNFQMVSTRRFPPPASDAFWLYLDETFIPDGRYLVEAKSDVVGGDPVVYEIIIRAGMRIDFIPPAGLSTPPFCTITGTEVDPEGNPIVGMEVRALLEPKKMNSVAAVWGRVQGEAATTTDLSGRWFLHLAPTERLIPPTRYRVIRRHISTGRDENRNLFVPNQVSASFDDALVLTSIKDGEIESAGPAASPNIPAGYVLMTGQIVDVIGRPMPDLQITVGTAGQQVPTSMVPNTIGATVAAAVFQPETRFITSTSSDRVQTISGYPGAPINNTVLPVGSELISVTDGFGATYAPPFFTFIPSSGALTFTQPFVGVVKFRVPSDGKFSIALAPATAYWIQIGPKAMRLPFIVLGGIPSFDVGAIAYPAQILQQPGSTSWGGWVTWM